VTLTSFKNSKSDIVEEISYYKIFRFIYGACKNVY